MTAADIDRSENRRMARGRTTPSSPTTVTGACELLHRATDDARLAGGYGGVDPTPYVNTIPPTRTPEYLVTSGSSGASDVIRWNGRPAMVLQANKESSESLDGDIARPLMSPRPPLHEVRLQSIFWHAPSETKHGGDLIDTRQRSSPGIYARAPSRVASARRTCSASARRPRATANLVPTRTRG